MNIKLVMIQIATLAMLMVGCKSSADTATVDSQIAAPPISGMRPAKAVAKVHIYKTNGDYDNYVPVSLDASRKQIMSFPAPSDLSESSMPVKLDNGYLLDRRGVGENTAFTRYTYKEYMALQEAPAPSELIKAIIPDARVTEIVEMPFTVGSTDEVSRCNELITAGLPGCKVLFPQQRQITIKNQ